MHSTSALGGINSLAEIAETAAVLFSVMVIPSITAMTFPRSGSKSNTVA
uniref:Uncharacterized protein n=1 Tax=Anguilla anguilla TaxID=7936 RepID=A0A0E9QLC7_ANGAN